MPDVRIVLVGDDPYDSAPEYAAQVRAAEGVEHIPWVPDGAAVMRHLDVLVAPSRQEPFGTVLAEAMAAGTPVVATRVGGLAEVVADGVTGRLVTPGDPAELAAAVLEVLADRERMGAAARAHAQQFGADAYADRVERDPAGGGVRTMRVVFDSRPAQDPRGIGRYASCLLTALRETARPPTTRSSRATARAAATSSTRPGSTARCCARRARRS